MHLKERLRVEFGCDGAADTDVQVWIVETDQEVQGAAVTSRAPLPLVRQLLSDFLHRPLGENDFLRESSGRPRLLKQETPFDFNVSHTGLWLAVAASQGNRVGIDIEFSTRPLSMRLQTWLGSPGQQQEALKAWTLNEAFVKAIGCGLRERHIGGIAHSVAMSERSACGQFSYGMTYRRRWSLMTVLREPLLLGLALRHAVSPAPQRIQVSWIYPHEA